jgi:nucleotide-binding universal stress UspA family protein
MFRSILVPLDRTPFAEQAVPLAVAVARRTGAKVDLATVHHAYYVDEPVPAHAPFDRERDERIRRDEQAYLDALAGRATGVSVSTAVLTGTAVLPNTVADALLERAAAERTELIVMATHARGAMGRLAAAGSVADELVRRASLPVLLWPGERAVGPTGPAIDRMLIALSGAAAPERILEPAAGVARALGSRCVLLRVVEAANPSGVAEAEAYLAGVAARLAGQGVQAETRVVTAPVAADAILAAAEREGCGLIALAGEGHTRVGRLVLGSTAEKVIVGASTPVLALRTTAGW